jgi:hypothetical protein
MDEAMGTGDIVIGIFAAFGVLVLIVVFIFVMKTIVLKKDEETDEQP